MPNLYDFQKEAIHQLRLGFKAGHRCQLLYLPTGAGKTETALSMLKSASDKGNKSAFLIDRRVLCYQTSQRMDKYSIKHGVQMAGFDRWDRKQPIQVCSTQTLEASNSFPESSVIFVDECHTTRKSVQEFIKNNESVKVIGLSASPFTKGLANIYTNIVNGSTPKILTESGKLSKLRVFVANEIDMTGAKKIAGEWSSKEVEERGIKITCDVVKTWQEKTYSIFGRPRKTIVFCAGVKHGQDLAQQFGKAGYNFISISYKDTDKDWRNEVFEEFAKPDSSIHGLIATDILTKGFDCPDVMIGVQARPFSKSFSSHVQQIGRITRSAPGKEYAVLIDHAGNYGRFYDQWEDLYHNGVSELKDGAEKTKPEPTKKEKEDRKCPKCGCFWEKSDTCAHCGFVIVGHAEIIQLHGKIEEFVKPEKFSSEYKEQFFRELLGYARESKKKDGWAFHKYIEKFGVEPKWKKLTSPCTTETKNWITSRNIARSYVLSR